MVKRANAHASELVNPASEQTRAGQVAATRKTNMQAKRSKLPTQASRRACREATKSVGHTNSYKLGNKRGLSNTTNKVFIIKRSQLIK